MFCILFRDYNNNKKGPSFHVFIPPTALRLLTLQNQLIEIHYHLVLQGFISPTNILLILIPEIVFEKVQPFGPSDRLNS